MIRRCFVVLSLLLWIADAHGEATVTRLLRSGGSGHKKDLVIVGDGFQAGADQTTFNNFVDSYVMNGVFAEGPVWEDMNAFNIYRVNLESHDSGVTQIDADGHVTVARDTALGFRFSGVWDRCWMEPGPNTNSTLDLLLTLLVGDFDYVFVVLNEPGFGGCRRGDQLAVTLGTNWTVGAHEMGHMVGDLADEYCGCGKYTHGEPHRVNITKKTDRTKIKWRDFINPSAPVPTGVNPTPGCLGGCTGYNQGTPPAGWSNSDDAGLFEGALYRDTAIYRPVVNCRMRNNSPPFCPVCYNRMKEVLDHTLEYTFHEAYVGDFTGDGNQDVVIHNDNSLALYRSVGTEMEPLWIVTGAIPLWSEFKSGDRFFVADFNNDGKDDLYVFNASDWSVPQFGMLRSTGSGFECIRRFSGKLPGWDDMRAHDQFYVADFDHDGNDDLYIFNGRDWSVGYLEMLRSTGSNLAYVHRYDDVLPGWDEMKSHDQFYVADFDSDQRQDLYVFNGQDWSVGYLELLKSNGTSLDYVRRYDDTLPGWGEMKRHDEFFVADFDGDQRDDLYIFNGRDWSIDYLEMLRSTGTMMTNTHRFDGTVPGWDGLATHDRFFVADINGDKRDDLYAYNSEDWSTEYLGTLRSTGTSLAGGWQADWIGIWNLGSSDLFLPANFNGGTGWTDLLVRNDNWFGLLESHASSVALTAIYPKWVHRHKYHSKMWW